MYFLGLRLYGEGTCAKPGFCYFYQETPGFEPRDVCGPGPGALPLGHHTYDIDNVQYGKQYFIFTNLFNFPLYLLKKKITAFLQQQKNNVSVLKNAGKALQ